jgi:hypothetical protein
MSVSCSAYPLLRKGPVTYPLLPGLCHLVLWPASETLESRERPNYMTLSLNLVVRYAELSSIVNVRSPAMLWSPLCFRLCSLVNIFAVAVTSERFCAFALFVHEVDVGGRAILFAPFSKSFGWERRATSLLCEDPGTSFAFALCFGSCKDAQRCAFARLRQRKGARRCHSSIPTGGPMAFRNDLRYIAGKGSRFLWSHVSGRRRRPLRGRTVKGTRGSSRARQTRSRVTFRDAKRWQRGGQHEAILGTTSNYHFHPSIRQKPSNRIRYDVVDGVRGGFGSHGLGSLHKVN